MREANVIFLNGPTNFQSCLAASTSPTISISRGSPQPRPRSWARRMYLIDSGSKPISFAATASMATWSALASITFFTCGTMQRGPGPSPAKVPSITAKTPRWIFFWIISRSTSVSWITGCVQWRCSFSSPPNAFFIAPVVVVKTCVFTVGRWMMFSPMKRFGIMKPSG